MDSGVTGEDEATTILTFASGMSGPRMALSWRSRRIHGAPTRHRNERRSGRGLSNARILDVGCGTGWLANALLPLGKRGAPTSRPKRSRMEDATSRRGASIR